MATRKRAATFRGFALREDADGNMVLDTSTPEGVKAKEALYVEAANAAYDDGVRIHNGVSDDVLKVALAMFPVLSRGSRVSRSQRKLIGAVLLDRAAKDALKATDAPKASKARSGSKKAPSTTKATKVASGAQEAPTDPDEALAVHIGQAVGEAIFKALKAR